MSKSLPPETDNNRSKEPKSICLFSCLLSLESLVKMKDLNAFCRSCK